MEKIIHKDNLTNLRDKLSQLKQTIVFTNGCFDILHPGHIDILSKSKAKGDILIVGINDDASITQLKGPSRPINNLSDRMKMLASLESTDYIIPFSEETPYHLIEILQPDILVKGGDYTIDTIVGADLVINNGGKVEIIELLDGYSTTSMIEKIKNLKS